jgi:hypothetical protein
LAGSGGDDGLGHIERRNRELAQLLSENLIDFYSAREEEFRAGIKTNHEILPRGQNRWNNFVLSVSNSRTDRFGIVFGF